MDSRGGSTSSNCPTCTPSTYATGASALNGKGLNTARCMPVEETPLDSHTEIEVAPVIRLTGGSAAGGVANRVVRVGFSGRS